MSTFFKYHHHNYKSMTEKLSIPLMLPQNLTGKIRIKINCSLENITIPNLTENGCSQKKKKKHPKARLCLLVFLKYKIPMQTLSSVIFQSLHLQQDNWKKKKNKKTRMTFLDGLQRISTFFPKTILVFKSVNEHLKKYQNIVLKTNEVTVH